MISWRTDGTLEGTILLTPDGQYVRRDQLLDVDDMLYFVSRIGIWRTKGISGDIQVLFDEPQATGFLDFIGRTKDLLFFKFDDGYHGVELWALPLEGEPSRIPDWQQY